jgi:hypothetical protein
MQDLKMNIPFQGAISKELSFCKDFHVVFKNESYF